VADWIFTTAENVWNSACRENCNTFNAQYTFSLSFGIFEIIKPKLVGMPEFLLLCLKF
jgi:hypothetical protein